MENLIQMDDLGVTPFFGNTHITQHQPPPQKNLPKILPLRTPPPHLLLAASADGWEAS